MLLYAQETTISPKHQISAGYMGSNFVRPGAVISHYYKFWEADKTKTTKKGKIKPRLLELNIVNRAGFYNHKQNHLGAMLTTGVQISLIRKKGKFLSIGPQTGYFQRFLNEDTYIVSETGEVQRKHFSGTAQWTIGLQTRIGKDFSYNNPDNRFGWYLASNLLWSMPFGSGYINSSLVELGVFYSLKK
jgi:hypothetical protein